MEQNNKKTQDIGITNDVSFRDMMLSDRVLAGLLKYNFEKPSLIQKRAIPAGRYGSDLIIQSKSGTGKTLVYCTIILEQYKPAIRSPQSLIVVPTREIALQVEEYLSNIGSKCRRFSVACVIGGRDIAEDRKRISKCKAIVGTPGRILHMINNNCLCLKNIRTFVLDEADKLVSEDFYGDINKFLNALKKDRQIIATSATYPDGLDELIASFMHNPITISTLIDTPVLIGVKQFVISVDEFAIPNSVQNSTPSIQTMWRKIVAVNYILSTTAYMQCILFSNSQFRADSYANYLRQMGWPLELLLGSHDQRTRTATLENFRQYKSRICVTSDLMARGVDIVNVNLVINLDVPNDSSTYLHRIGRCGRFGRRGMAITMVSDENEMEKFRKLLGSIGGSKMKVAKFPTSLKGGTNYNAWNSTEDSQSEDLFVFGLIDQNESNAVETNKSRIEQEIAHNGEEKPQPKNETEADTVESNNFKLLEVTKLLIDSNLKQKEIMENVDEDLFSNYQDCIDNMQPEDAIPVDSFAQSQCIPKLVAPIIDIEKTFRLIGNYSRMKKKPQSKNDVQEDTVRSNNFNQLYSDLEPKKTVGNIDEDLFLNYQNCMNIQPDVSADLFDDYVQFQNNVEQNDGQNIEHEDQDQNQKEEESTERVERMVTVPGYYESVKNLNGELEGENSIRNQQKENMVNENDTSQMDSPEILQELPIADNFWIQTYRKQLNDINRYLQYSNL